MKTGCFQISVFVFFFRYIPRHGISGSIQFSHSVVSDSLPPHGLQHPRLPCPSPTPRAYSNLRPSSQWYYSTISSCVILFSSCLQSFPASESFPRSQFFASDSQSIRASASASVPPMNIQDWFPLQLTALILQSKGLSRVFNTTVQTHQFFSAQLSLWSNSHIHTWLLQKPQLWLYRPLSARYLCLCFLTCWVHHNFSSKEQASFNFMAAVTIHSDFRAQESKVSLLPLFPHLFAMKWWDWMPWSYSFEC